MEGKFEELVQLYGRNIRAVGFPQMFARERDKVSEELYEQLRLAKAMNQETTRDTAASFIRPEGGATTSRGCRCPSLEASPRRGRISAVALRPSWGCASQP